MLKSDPSEVVSEELVWEILKWMPVKSLMRFKCVCKQWRSIILNPLFAGMYRGGFNGLLLTGPETWKHPNRDIFYLNIRENACDGVSASISLHQIMNQPRSMRFNAPVDGLVCFYYRQYSSIYNVATREIMVLPVSMWESDFSIYNLGFDRSNKVYKILKTCPLYDRHGLFFKHNLNSEIFTIGVDSSWRSIDPAPRHLTTFAYCNNGVLYWKDEGISTINTGRHLLSFDLAREEFQFIAIPQEFLYCSWLFGPKAALVSYQMRQPGGGHKKITNLLFDDDDQSRVCKVGSAIGSWRKHEIDASISEELYSFRAVSTLPNGKVIFIHNSAWAWNSLVPFYIYDEGKSELQKCFISVCNSSSIAAQHIVDTSRFENAFYFEENIFPLNCLGST